MSLESDKPLAGLSEQDKPAIGLKVVSVLNYVFSGLMLIFAILCFIAGVAFILNKESFTQQIFGNLSGALGNEISTAFSTVLTSFGIITTLLSFVLLAIGGLLLFVGIGLWKGKK